MNYRHGKFLKKKKEKKRKKTGGTKTDEAPDYWIHLQNKTAHSNLGEVEELFLMIKETKLKSYIKTIAQYCRNSAFQNNKTKIL